MDDSGTSDSWNKLAISRNNSQWITNIKSELIDDADSSAGASGFSLDYDPFADTKSEEGASSTHGFQSTKPSCSVLVVEKKRQVDEAPGHREQRLAKMSAYAAHRLANESPEQRAVRLKRMSAYAAKRLASETGEQRAKRLARMSIYAAKRLANETQEQRQERLVRMSAYAARRHEMKKMNASVTGNGRKTRTSFNSISADDSNSKDTAN